MCLCVCLFVSVYLYLCIIFRWLIVMLAHLAYHVYIQCVVYLAAAEGSTLVLHDNDQYRSDKSLHPKLLLKSRCVFVYCKLVVIAHMTFLSLMYQGTQ